MDYESASNVEKAEHERRHGRFSLLAGLVILASGAGEALRGDFAFAGIIGFTALMPLSIAKDRFRTARYYAQQQDTQE